MKCTRCFQCSYTSRLYHENEDIVIALHRIRCLYRALFVTHRALLLRLDSMSVLLCSTALFFVIHAFVITISNLVQPMIYGSAPVPNNKCGFRSARSRIVCANTELAHANQLPANYQYCPGRKSKRITTHEYTPDYDQHPHSRAPIPTDSLF